jgi:hypothetical protein
MFMNSRTPEKPYRADDRQQDYEAAGRGHDGDRIREAGKAGAAAAGDAARARLDQGRRTASDAASGTARALDEAASSLSAQDHESLARVTSSLAEQLSRFASSLEQRNIDELSREARRVAREHPGLFIAGGAALGLALGRFFRASGRRRHSPSSIESRAPDQEREEHWLPSESTAGLDTSTSRRADDPDRLPNS